MQARRLVNGLVLHNRSAAMAGRLMCREVMMLGLERDPLYRRGYDSIQPSPVRVLDWAILAVCGVLAFAGAVCAAIIIAGVLEQW